MALGNQFCDEVVVVGMSAEVAGADNLEELWNVLYSAKSQHTEVPSSRLSFDNTPWRGPNPRTKWYGNFMNHYDRFDHKFFKKSPREATSMDPQQRRLLQAAYQAIEQSGHFNRTENDNRIGCFIGATEADYSNNIACHAPNAYVATGLLKSLLAGRISHYFGFTGPSLVIDTACSSSAVAIHYACKSILSGECSAALAGAAGIITTPIWHQNLAAASFLSPTGQCKPFDDNGDGYCRGEGVAAVMLKSKSAAIRDGDVIFGCIPASVVLQMENCTPIVVPNQPSLTGLFTKVLDQARLQPREVELVEAHGTGTAVGDAAEYESIRDIFGGPQRSSTLPIGSLKGWIGHTEAVSGILALIKILLMMHHNTIPQQASFQTMSRRIDVKSTDMIEVPIRPRPWTSSTQIALINNYGASGSIASLVVTNANQTAPNGASQRHEKQPALPFWIGGHDQKSIVRYAQAMLRSIKSESAPSTSRDIRSLAFNLSRQSNRTLPSKAIFSASSIPGLEERLSEVVSGKIETQPSAPSIQHVILCFGGQRGRFVGLDRNLVENVTVLRKHLDECDSILQSIRMPSIYPVIFQTEDIEDLIELQTSLFAVQYSYAKTWMDCGIKPDALIGHSFGELTALCVSGILSLRDALTLISRRAQWIQDKWSSDRGSMLLVEGAEDELLQALNQTNLEVTEGKISIACYNSETTFTLAGSSSATDTFKSVHASLPGTHLVVKALPVTHAYHSHLVTDAFLRGVGDLTSDLSFGKANINVQFASREPLTTIDNVFVQDHLRNPVYFRDAVSRLSKEFPSAIWLEAGSGSGITSMARKAHPNPERSLFKGLDMSRESSMDNLAKVCTSLWKVGTNVSFWPHSRLQTSDYTPSLLPPYQFEETRHWFELKSLQDMIPQVSSSLFADGKETPKKDCLWEFDTFINGNENEPRFSINTACSEFQQALAGHVVVGARGIAAETVILDIVSESLLSIGCHGVAREKINPCFRNVKNQAPIMFEQDSRLFLNCSFDPIRNKWFWKYVSIDGSGSTSTHATGETTLSQLKSEAYRDEFEQLERLVPYQTCKSLLESNDVDDVLQGRNVYRMFDEIVICGPSFQGLERLVGQENRSAGRVVKEYDTKTWLDPYLSECMCQAGGVFVNCMTDRSSDDMYIAKGLRRWMRSPKVGRSYSRPKVWEIYANHHPTSADMFTTDIFVFDPRNGLLMEVVLGISYVKIPKQTMRAILKCTVDQSDNRNLATRIDVSSGQKKILTPSTSSESKLDEQEVVETAIVPAKDSCSLDLLEALRSIISDLTGVEIEEIQADTPFADIGVDSLMGMELAKEIETAWKINFDLASLFDIVTVSDCAIVVLKLMGKDEAAKTFKATNGTSVKSNTNQPSVPSISKSQPDQPSLESEVHLDQNLVLDIFRGASGQVDDCVDKHGLSRYMEQVLPIKDELCIALTVEAFEQLGCNLRNAQPDEVISLVPFLERHKLFVDYLYKHILAESGLIRTAGTKYVRTMKPLPLKPSKTILEKGSREHPDFARVLELTYYTGCDLAGMLGGSVDPLRLIFGADDGVAGVAHIYCDSALNKVWYAHMENIVEQILRRSQHQEGPLKILELGAGFGGTTAGMAKMLDRLGVPVEYTFSDIATTMVAKARKKYGGFKFMKFKVVDVEKTPPPELFQTQHLVLASNMMHATHNLVQSASNARRLLRDDGCLMLLEMSHTMMWIDMVFGGLEGWWLFNDGRDHAIANEYRWKADLTKAGFSRVEWTAGLTREANFQKVYVATAAVP